MFIPLPIVIVVGLILLVMIAHIVRMSRRRDPLLDASSLAARAPLATIRDTPPGAPSATLTPEVELQVRALVEGGRWIEAVKLVHQVTRLDLKRSKELVEALG